jgi:hypothetical protein
MAVTRREKPTGRPHLFVADPDVPPDQSGRATCRCQLVGEPGDAHHTLPDAPVRDVQQLRAGEDGGEE